MFLLQHLFFQEIPSLIYLQSGYNSNNTAVMANAELPYAYHCFLLIREML